MKYRTKLYLSLLSIAMGSTLLALYIVYTETSKLVFKEFKNEVISIAVTTASLVDGELLKSICGPEDVKSPQYLLFQNQLFKSKNANQNREVYVESIYVIKPSSSNPNQLVYKVDADNTPLLPGTIYDAADAKDILSHLNKSFANSHFIADHWGLWLSGFAPIFDSEGNYLATLGIDVSATEVTKELNELISFGLSALGASLGLALIIAAILSKQVTSSLDTLCAAVKEVGKGNLKHKASLHTHDEFNDLAIAINEMSRGLEERNRLKMSFARYVSQHVLEKILKSDTPMKLEGERRKITVLFSDIRQFTHLAERLSPEEVVRLLNEYFEKMLEAIFSNMGTLDKFIGDGIMVEFGAPLDDSFQESHAISAALEMQEKLKNLCEKWKEEGKPIIDMGIGIHTGQAVVGNIGSERRTEYTAIGDTVNVAARLEQTTKMMKSPLLVSETTFLAAFEYWGEKKLPFEYKKIGPMTLAGRTEPITIYAIYPLSSPPSSPG